MATKAEKLRLLGEIQKMFGVKDEDIATLPEQINTFIGRVAVQPCIVAFAFNPITLQLSQVATSEIPREARAYQAAAQVTSRVAQQLSNIAMEVATDVGKQERVEEPEQQLEDN